MQSGSAMKIQSTNALNCRRPTQYCERQSADDQYNRLTINTSNWAQFSSICSKNCKKLFSNSITCSEEGLKNKTETSIWLSLPNPRVLLFHLVTIPRDYKSSTLFAKWQFVWLYPLPLERRATCRCHEFALVVPYFWHLPLAKLHVHCELVS